ncbi:formyl transferase [Arenibacter nanhaiticus]|nr:formyl transferase [Arenibacter nanhaiticus]
MNKKIVMLVGHGQSAKFMYNGLKDEFEIMNVLRAGYTSKGRVNFLKRRAKRLGYSKLIGQILFQICCVRLLNVFSKARVEELKRNLQLSEEDINKNILIDVPSVNSDECLKVLKRLNPDIIIVNGTEIISKKILNGIRATFVNTHVGITPKYRGVHGGYWALASDDKDNCGVTVHLVDAGIDTGGILRQGIIKVTPQDNFITYPYLQLAEGITCMKLALKDILNDNILPVKRDLESKLWYHPTLWQYLYVRITKGVK